MTCSRYCLYAGYTINLIWNQSFTAWNVLSAELCFSYLPTNPSHVSPGLPVIHSYTYPPQEQHRPHDSLLLLSLCSLLSSVLTLTDPPLSLSPAGQFQPGHMTAEFRPQGSRCGRRANGNAGVIWVELIALFYPPAKQCKPPPPSLPPSLSLSYSLYLSLVGFSQSQQKCTDGQRLQTWTQGPIKLSCFVVKAELLCWAVEFVQQLTGSPAGWNYMQFFMFNNIQTHIQARFSYTHTTCPQSFTFKHLRTKTSCLKNALESKIIN